MAAASSTCPRFKWYGAGPVGGGRSRQGWGAFVSVSTTGALVKLCGIRSGANTCAPAASGNFGFFFRYAAASTTVALRAGLAAAAVLRRFIARPLTKTAFGYILARSL